MRKPKERGHAAGRNAAETGELCAAVPAESPKVREERLAALRHSLVSGTYEVSSEQIASKLMELMLDGPAPGTEDQVLSPVSGRDAECLKD